MKSKIFRAAALVLPILIIGVLYSCRKASPTQAQSTTPPASSDSVSLGTISYTPDYSSQKSVRLDTGSASISVTDGAGIKWKLSIPKQDVSAPVTISMTPIGDVRSDSVIDIKGGVVFQPDGFQFASPAKLTVTFPSSGTAPYIFYTFSQDGKDVGFTGAADTGQVYTVDVTHFSGYAFGLPLNGDGICKIATAKYNAALAEEDSILKLPITVPVPPDVDLDCGIDSSKMSTVREYVKKFFQPEDAVIRRLLGAGSALRLLSCGPSSVQAGFLAKADELASRLFQKAQQAYQDYQSNDKKYVAVANVLLKAHAAADMLGASPSGANQTLAELGAWAETCYKDQLSRLRQNHDYKAVRSLWELSAQAELFGASIPSVLSDLQSALTFTFELKEGAISIGTFPNGDPPDSEQVIIQGAFRIQPDIPGTGQTGIWTGSGDINYVYGLTGDGCSNDYTGKVYPSHDKIDLPQSFPFQVTVDSFDACKSGTIEVSFDSLGTAPEKWIYGFDAPKGTNCGNWQSDWQNSGDASTLALINDVAFEGQPYYDFTAASFDLRLPFHNGFSTPVDTTFVATSTDSIPYQVKVFNKVELNIKLVHTPQ